MKKNIPFYKNLKSDKHCFQACLKMILKFCFPRKNYSFSFLDKISKHRRGKWTWQGASLLYLASIGFEVVNIENLNYKLFAKEGEKYLRHIWDQLTFNIQKRFSDLNSEQKIAKLLVASSSVKLLNKQASVKDVRHYFKRGYLVMVSVNPFALLRRAGYASHSVLVKDINTQYITFHDPGLPPLKNRKISLRLFEKAMTPPLKNDTNVMAVKLLTKSKT